MSACCASVLVESPVPVHVQTAVVVTPVISFQPVKRSAISWRHPVADSRCRRGRKCGEMRLNADRNRCACPGEAKEGHRVLDPRIEASDIGAVSVDAVQEQPGHERVMLSEPAHQGTVDLSNPRAIFAGSPPRFTWSRVTYEAYVVSRTSARPQVDAMKGRGLRSS